MWTTAEGGGPFALRSVSTLTHTHTCLPCRCCLHQNEFRCLACMQIWYPLNICTTDHSKSRENEDTDTHKNASYLFMWSHGNLHMILFKMGWISLAWLDNTRDSPKCNFALQFTGHNGPNESGKYCLACVDDPGKYLLSCKVSGRISNVHRMLWQRRWERIWIRLC